MSNVLDENYWTEEEDLILLKLVRLFGLKKWKTISIHLNQIFKDSNKKAKVCKDRYYKNLCDSVKKERWSLAEECLFFNIHKVLKNKWSTIARFLPGRTDTNIKNHFYSSLRKFSRKIQNSKEFSKDSKLKDKVKSFYLILYIRDRFIFLSKYYNHTLNQIDNRRLLDEEKIDITKNFEDTFIGEIICYFSGNIDNLNKYLHKTCVNILKEDKKVEVGEIDVNSTQDIMRIEDKIKELTNMSTINTCLKNIGKLDKFRENVNIQQENEKCNMEYDTKSKNPKNFMERPINIKINNNINFNFDQNYSLKNVINDQSERTVNDGLDNVIDKFLKVKRVKNDIVSLFKLHQYNLNSFRNKNVSDEDINVQEISCTTLTPQVMYFLENSGNFGKIKEVLLQIISNNINNTDNLKKVNKLRSSSKEMNKNNEMDDIIQNYFCSNNFSCLTENPNIVNTFGFMDPYESTFINKKRSNFENN